MTKEEKCNVCKRGYMILDEYGGGSLFDEPTHVCNFCEYTEDVYDSLRNLYKHKDKK